MSDSPAPERVATLRAVLARWDIPHITSIEALHEDYAVFKIKTVGPAFTLKDITNAPDLHRLEFTRDVLQHVARAGVRVPVPVPSRSAQCAVQSEGRYYLLSEFIEAGESPRSSPTSLTTAD